jgi:hypothetical protein
MAIKFLKGLYFTDGIKTLQRTNEEGQKVLVQDLGSSLFPQIITQIDEIMHVLIQVPEVVKMRYETLRE